MNLWVREIAQVGIQKAMGGCLHSLTRAVICLDRKWSPKGFTVNKHSERDREKRL